MKKIILLITLCLSLLAEDIVVFENEYNVLALEKKVKKLIIGNKDILNVSLLGLASDAKTTLKLFGKKSGNTSILIMYKDKSIQNYHVYVNQNLGFIQKMINIIEPNLSINRVGDGSTVISGEFKDPHEKKRIYKLLENAGIDMTRMMDLTQTIKVNKMVRTKLYLVEVNNQKAKELGGVTGLGFFNEYTNLNLNPTSATGVTFSGFLLDHTKNFVSQTGNSVVGTLNFLETKGIAKILDDTVLITTEDKNASFHVGGEVYIPIGLTQNTGSGPTIQLEEKEYGLRLTLTSYFMEKDGFMHIDVEIKDSEFDTNHEHDVQLGEFTVVPSFISKNIKTDVVSKSGQVIALGGRLHAEEIDQEKKIPFLGDIPILGELFKSTVRSTKENDLLFFLVPEIVDANEDLDDRDFYKEYKNSNLEFNKNALDMSPSKPEPLVVVEDPTLVRKTDTSTLSQADEPMIDLTKDKIIIETEEKNKDESKLGKEIFLDDDVTVEVVNIEVVAQSLDKKENIPKKEILTNETKTVEESKSLNAEPSTETVVEIIKKDEELTAVPAEIKIVEENQNLNAEPSADIVIEKIKKDEEIIPVLAEIKTVEESKNLNTQPSADTVIEMIKEDEEIIGVTDEIDRPKKYNKPEMNKKYMVSAEKIFLRKKPVDGRRSDVWIKGHIFTVEREEDIKGSTWLKVKEDCLKECRLLEKSLWISKKYTEEL